MFISLDPNLVISHNVTGSDSLKSWEGSQARTERIGLLEIFAVIVLDKEARLYVAL